MNLCISPLSSAVEGSYSGPRLDGGEVTAEFMEETMRWFKDQKKLHRKFAYQVRVCVCSGE